MTPNPSDRVCAKCSAILVWAGAPQRGQYRHSRPGGQLYITTHEPIPKPQWEGEQ